MPAGPLPLTGERTVPGVEVENYWFRRHEAAYRAVLPWLVGADVLDAGAGEGYGAAMLATVAHRVFAVDYDQAAAAHCAAAYPEVRPVRANLTALPVRDGALGAVVSMQVVEHLWDQPGFVAECARVLRKTGLLALSTPNRLTFSPGRDTPVNPFHSVELSASELADLVSPHFRVTRLYGIGHGRRLRRLDRRYAGTVARGGDGSEIGCGVGFVDAQLATPPAVWHPDLRRAVAAVTTADFAVRTRDLDASLDLVLLGTRR
jgi:SAM-dependent methyltransferase